MTSTSASPDLTVTKALQAALQTVRNNVDAFGAAYPDDTTTDGRYLLRPETLIFGEGANRGWTTGFWAGLQWLAWQHTGDRAHLDSALGHVADFTRRAELGEDLATHDIGFLYSLSTVPAWRLLGDESAKAASLRAAELLAARFLPGPGIIQAWGELSDPEQAGRTIIDSLMNMPLLRWASEVSGDPQYAEMADRHTLQLKRHLLRPDGTSFHTFYWDTLSGEPLRGATQQGAFDDSCWARGQAWGIYGFALGYKANAEPELLEAARRCAEYFLKRLPADHVPYWDLVYGDGDDAPRDSSAAAIAACGLLELAELTEDTEEAQRWRAAVTDIRRSLIENYTPQDPQSSDALLLHGVYDMPKDVGIDEGNLWGDYFYLELLTRTNPPNPPQQWIPYW